MRRRQRQPDDSTLDRHVTEVDLDSAETAIHELERYRRSTRVGIQPHAIAEQDRSDVQVDLVYESALEQLPSNGCGEHLDVLAASGTLRDGQRFGDVAVEEGQGLGRVVSSG